MYVIATLFSCVFIGHVSDDDTRVIGVGSGGDVVLLVVLHGGGGDN